MSGWSFWVDRGGTFTDIVARSPAGELVVHKLLSENPGRYDDAAVHGIGEVMIRHGDRGGAIAEVKLGTTVATNALLERKGEPTVLAITRGLGDLLRIGHQARPRLFDRNIRLPEALYERVVEIDERLMADGSVLRPLDLAAARRDLAEAFARGFRALAIVLMHAWRNPAHEAALEAVAREIGFEQVSASHLVSPLMKIVGRGDTAVVDAYLSPPLRRYVNGVTDTLPPGVPLAFMQSNGGLAPADRFRGRDAILSGPRRRGGRHGRGGARGRLREGDRLRHGRHLHRCLPLCRSLRTRAGHRGRRGAPARADDEHPHRGGGGRLDLPLRRGAPEGRAAERRGGAGARLLPPRRPPNGNRLQPAVGPHPARGLPRRVRTERR